MKITRNTDGVKKFAKEKSKLSQKRAEEGIRDMILNNEIINFNTVMKKTGLSKSYLYQNKQIKKKIDSLRNINFSKNKIKKTINQSSDKSRDTLIAAQKIKISNLEKENKELKKEIEKLRGTIYEKI